MRRGARRVRLDPEGASAVLAEMPPDARKRMKSALRALALDASGRTGGHDVKRLRLKGNPPAYRLKLGPWRACWLLRDETLDGLRIFHRSEGYGWIERMYP